MTKMLAPLPPSEREIIQLVENQLGESPESVDVLRSGAWSSAIAVTVHSGAYVVRFAATPDDFHCDAYAARFTNAELPIPQVHGIGELGQRFWCISDRMPGIHLDELTSDQMSRTLPSVARMLIAMREVDTSTSTGYGGWDRHGNGVFESFADQLLNVGNDDPNERGGGWKPLLAQNEYEQRIFNDGFARLQELCAFLAPDRHLIHQDTINYNVVVKDDHISGIFDWGTAMWGDAVYDLAWFRFWNPWYPQWAELDNPGYLEREVGIIGDHAVKRMHCCLLHIGLMHIRYNAFLGNLDAMNDVAKATERLL